MLFWSTNITVCQIVKSHFCMEVEIEGKDFDGKWWVILVYFSTADNIRRSQWVVLQHKKQNWGQKWIMGGDFNDIIRSDDKKSGKRRVKSSFLPFRSFVRKMEMEVVPFKGNRWT